jgi:hypothetical protein
MSAARMQLRGNCQCCGREQAVIDGRMAKHGYEVVGRGHGGYFKGVCSGNRYQPLQVQREVADAIIAECRADANLLDIRAGQYRAGAIKPEFCKGHYSAKLRDYEKIPFAEATEYQRADAIKGAAYECASRARAARAHADGLERLANEKHGQPLREVPVDDGPAPIFNGDKRKDQRGVLVAQSVYRGMVGWKDERGFTGKMSTRRWRLLERAA